MNYNMLTASAEFINEDGDTLAVDKGFARYVQIRDLTYFNESKEYYEFVLKTEPVKLAIQIKWNLERIETIDGTGTKSAHRNKSNTVYSPTLGKVVSNETITYRKDSTYFLIDKREEPVKANRANFLKFFAAHKSQIEAFIKESDINFKREADLRKLFDFCIPLASGQ